MSRTDTAAGTLQIALFNKRHENKLVISTFIHEVPMATTNAESINKQGGLLVSE